METPKIIRKSLVNIRGAVPQIFLMSFAEGSTEGMTKTR